MSIARKTQGVYARLAGFLFLWLIATGLTGVLTTSSIVGSGSFAEKAARVVASQRLYRIGLCADLLETLSAAVLAFALYVVLKPLDAFLAELAMYFRLAESFIGSVGMILGFARLSAYTSNPPSEALVNLTRWAGTASYNIGSIAFSAGSLLFFILFLRSRYIPKILSRFGIFASIAVTIIAFGGLLFPEYSSQLQYG